ncbi:MAG: sugar phosphate isomerase/epimerase [Gemmatimonadetes bacterium]|nr:sugar phosphate isomerase/epimerase [Gemmatimonadota bacterium]MDA1103283.1 sugar phosphate isomerase/epimerase [Gemmatimonadota bacterium]
MIDRRGFLAAVPATAYASKRALSQGGASFSRDVTLPIDRIGVQLYTVRNEMAANADATLATIAEIGYAEVELAGLYGMTAREMRAKLDAVGLRAASSHHGIDEVRSGWERTLAAAQELGQSQVVVPGLPGNERSAEGLRRIAEDFNRAAEAARAAGLRFGYHNHEWEFRPLEDGSVPMELLLDGTEAELVDWQMDIFWTVHGGGDPARAIRARSGRVTSVHVKDRTAAGDMVDVGDGIIDFSRLIPLAEGLGLRHAFVEHDQPQDALASVRRSFRHMMLNPGRP